MIDLEIWADGSGFAQDMAERIVAPGENGVRLLETYPYLSRMYTLISPHEMIADPIFHQNPDLPEVSNTRQATRRILCSGDSLWTLPDGRQLYVPQGDAWPVIDAMPGVEEVQEVPNHGAPMTLVRHTETIDKRVKAYNEEVGYDPGGSGSGCGCRTGVGWSGLVLPLFGLVLARRRRR